MSETIIARHGWNGGREDVFFVVDEGKHSLQLIPGTYEGVGDLFMCKPGFSGAKVVNMWELLSGWVKS